MSDQIWVGLVHAETKGRQLVPDDPAVVEDQQGRGWEPTGAKGTQQDFAFGIAVPPEPEKSSKATKAATKEEE